MKRALLALVCSLVPLSASAEVLEWDAPTTRIDGTAIVDGELSKYNVFVGGTFLRSVPAAEQSTDLGELAVGKHVLEVSVVDVDGLESDRALLEYVKKAKPGKPDKLRVKRVFIELGR